MAQFEVVLNDKQTPTPQWTVVEWVSTGNCGRSARTVFTQPLSERERAEEFAFVKNYEADLAIFHEFG